MDLFDKSDTKINFIPCLTWVRRGVAKPEPDILKLNEQELADIISQTKGEITELEAEQESGDEKENLGIQEDVKEELNQNANANKEATDKDIMSKYSLDDYDDDKEEETAKRLLGLGDLTVYTDPKDDPYMKEIEDEDDLDDKEDFKIRATDNLIVAGHVEGDSATLDVYIYNDVEDALYVHHDILLPSLPLAVEWMSFDPESDTRGNMVAVGYMQPVIDVWDLDIVDTLEPAFKLGKKAKKKKKIPGVGHKDAVLSLAWNSGAEHVLASGSVDQTVLLWDMNQLSPATTLRFHKEKVQSLAWHPFEAQTLATGCCDNKARIVDCRSQDSYKKWGVSGEVERVLWNHFSPYQCLASTDAGHIHCIDVRKDKDCLWTLSAHNESVTGLTLSTQCPGCMVSVSSDKAMKVWDIQGESPTFVAEMDAKLGVLQTVIGCPDAPFVVCMGGDNSSQNLKVYDVRESVQVRQRFGKRKLKNPLNTADFGYTTADEAEPKEEMETDAALSMDALTLGPLTSTSTSTSHSSGGAGAKFKPKNKKSKKKKEF